MCGIVSLAYRSDNPAMGYEGGELLKRLEYRGYDSTGGAFITEDQAITLLKAVGAPSKVVPDLAIDAQTGQRFIGQVRWATYGAVTQDNCQPHAMSCRLPFVGAHNGNISNTDTLKQRLAASGHTVVSDNDGEMITHLTEEFYADNQANAAEIVAQGRAALESAGVSVEVPDSALLLIDGARRADAEAEGSYAAAFCDPASPGIVAVKSGSSLYAGIGSDDAGEFVVVSSDLTSVLSKTRMLIPLAEGEGLWFTEREYVVFTLGERLTFDAPRPKRSKLNVRDTGLREPFAFYMDQEIASIPENIDEVVRYYLNTPETAALNAAFETVAPQAAVVVQRTRALYDADDETALEAADAALVADPVLAEVRAAVAGQPALAMDEGYQSEEQALLADLDRIAPDHRDDHHLIDLVLVWKKQRRVTEYLRQLVTDITTAQANGGRVFFVASGTSYHAALTGAVFFNNLAGVGVIPAYPGMFRSMYLGSLTTNDLLIGISQSGETKDLVDIFTDVAARAPGVRRISLVNNENSRIPQELSAYYLPILCGPEIAVAATKSFINQLAVLLIVAASFSRSEAQVRRMLGTVRGLVGDTLDQTREGIESAAQHLYLEPSIHLLGTSLYGVAREGALKVREVVLNHAEGYDAAEFKHGPNTILGKNTLFSIHDLAAILERYEQGRAGGDASPEATGRDVLTARPELIEERFSNYPLLFICPPDERDIRITISQIHTHKIRGADILLLAERQEDLALAVEGHPAGIENYWAQVVDLPAGGDPNLFVFTASVALQRLAFRMSELKMTYLDELGIADHGVHPDAPKNVSKSITVD